MADTKTELPDFPFRCKDMKCCFYDFDLAMGDCFWMQLQSILLFFEDDYAIFGVIEPDPIKYFKSEYDSYNWFKLPLEFTSDDYWDTLNESPSENIVEAALFNSEKVVWASPSKKWIIWGQRATGLCIFASKLHSPINWHDINWAMNVCTYEVGEEFAQKFLANFSS